MHGYKVIIMDHICIKQCGAAHHCPPSAKVGNLLVDCIWNVMAHAQKPDFVFWRNGRIHLNRRGRQFSQLLAAEVCASAVLMLDAPCSNVVWRVLATHSIRQFPLHFPSCASPCAITFQLDFTVPLPTSPCHGVTFMYNYIKNQLDAPLAVLFISHCKITLHVSDAFCVHHQEY
jgi:hypothetical protein